MGVILRFGKAGSDEAWFGEFGWGMVRFGLIAIITCGVAWRGWVRYGEARSGRVRCGEGFKTQSYLPVGRRYSGVRYGLAWYGAARRGRGLLQLYLRARQGKVR